MSIRSALVFLTLSLCSFAKPCIARGDVAPLIRKDGVGEIRLGLTEAQIISGHEECVAAGTIMQVQGEDKAYKCTFPGGHSILLELNHLGVLWSIQVTDPFFKTVDGIGVGDSFGKVSARYPKAMFDRGNDNGFYITLRDGAFGFFSFETKGVPDSWFSAAQADMKKIAGAKLILVIVDNRDNMPGDGVIAP